ncbi:hypothetical protein KR222_001416 [Zaprionus bogoriensis]|nr:hypothetical protein KR222_001416 [Zaprionus bogoriensis]
MAVTPLAKRIFRLTYPAPLSVRIQSRQGVEYLDRAMRLVGWIPPRRRGAKRYIYLLWSCLVFVLTTVYLPIGLNSSLFVNFSDFTFGEFLSLLQISLNNLGVTTKTIIMVILLARLQETKTILDTLDERRQRDEDRLKIHETVALTNYICVGFFLLCTTFLTSVLVASLLNEKPPWIVYNPFFDWRYSRTNFWLQYLYEFIFGGIAVFQAVLEDGYAILFVLIFRGHIELLKDHLRDLRADPLKTEAENYEDLLGCIIDHKLILDCFNTLRPVIERTIFVQFLLIGLVLGINLINLSYFEDLYQSVSSLIYLFCIFFETFPFCYLCDLISEDCDELSELLSHSNWIDAEPKFKSTLRIFLHQLHQPIVYTAGGVFPISLNSNIKVAKFAFSVITIVKKMNLLEKFNTFGN